MERKKIGLDVERVNEKGGNDQKGVKYTTTQGS